MRSKICLFDDFYVAARPGTVRRFFKPQKLGEFGDGDLLQTYTSFFYDTNVGKYRLYYEVPVSEKSTEIRKLLMAEAESVEALIGGNAEKYEVEGLDPNGIHGCSVLLCSHDDRQYNYVLAGNFHANDRKTRCMFTAHSDDGIHFTDLHQIYEDYSDCYNSIYYNQYTKEYVITMRASLMDRRIFRICSNDLIHWSRPEMILHPEADGNNGVQLYAMGVSGADSMYYGLLWRFVTDMGQPDLSDMYGYMDCDLYYSYDGSHFMPTGLSPVCDRPVPPEYGCKQLWLLNTCNTPNDRTVICGGASSLMHGAEIVMKKFATTAFYDIRKDGFCALEGLGKNSTVYLKRFVCDGDELSVNANACLGSLSVALLNDKGQPYEGFSFEDCVALTHTDAVDHKITWKNASLKELIGKSVHIAIRLDGALLYTVTFDGRPCLRHPQKSTGDLMPTSPIDHTYG